MMANGKTTKEMVKAHMLGKMGKSIRVHGEMI